MSEEEYHHHHQQQHQAEMHQEEHERTAVMAKEEEEEIETFVEEDEMKPVVKEEAVEEVAAVQVEGEEEEEKEKACDAAAGADDETAEESCKVVVEEEEEENTPPKTKTTTMSSSQTTETEPVIIDAPPGCCDGCNDDIGGDNDFGIGTTTTAGTAGASTTRTLVIGKQQQQPSPFKVYIQETFLNGNGYILTHHKWIEMGALITMLYGFIFYIFWTRKMRMIRRAAAAAAEAQQQQQQQDNDALLLQGDDDDGDGKSTTTSKEAAAMNAATGTNPAATGFSFPMTDLVYVADLLKPDSSHMDIIYALISSPQVVAFSCGQLEMIHNIKQKKLQQQAIDEKKKKKQPDNVFTNLVDQDGWGDDDDDDDENNENISDEARLAVRKAKEEERQKKLHMERLKAATGQALPLLEGMDEGVLGQSWVEQTLAAEGQWPPPNGLGILQNKTFSYKDPDTGKVLQNLSPMNHPGLRRNLCMTAGRLSSVFLNTHPILVQAGQDKLIDQSYFKGAMEFRMRIIVLLEQTLRVALTLRSYQLFATMVECIALFKIGCIPGTGLPWFNGHMARTFGTLPRLSIGPVIFTKHVKSNTTTTTQQNDNNNDNNNKSPSEIIATDTIVAGQTAAVVLPVERTHAEKFTRTKLLQWKQQGVPAQVAMSSYREAWWFLLRSERLDNNNNDDTTTTTTPKKVPLNTEDGAKVLSKIHPNTVQRFNETAPEYHLVTAWPMIVQNIGQKSGTVKISVTAPEEPGRYRFHVGIQSQDFLGADQVVSVDITVVDSNATPTIYEGEEEEDDDDDDDDDNHDNEVREVD